MSLRRRFSKHSEHCLKRTIIPRRLLHYFTGLQTATDRLSGTELGEFCATFAGKAGLDAQQQRALEERLRREVSPDQ